MQLIDFYFPNWNPPTTRFLGKELYAVEIWHPDVHKLDFVLKYVVRMLEKESSSLPNFLLEEDSST